MQNRRSPYISGIRASLLVLDPSASSFSADAKLCSLPPLSGHFSARRSLNLSSSHTGSHHKPNSSLLPLPSAAFPTPPPCLHRPPNSNGQRGKIANGHEQTHAACTPRSRCITQPMDVLDPPAFPSLIDLTKSIGIERGRRGRTSAQQIWSFVSTPPPRHRSSHTLSPSFDCFLFAGLPWSSARFVKASEHDRKRASTGHVRGSVECAGLVAHSLSSSFFCVLSRACRR